MSDAVTGWIVVGSAQFPGPAGRPGGVLDARDARGVQSGTGNVQINHYAAAPAVRWPVLAVPPRRAGDVPRPGLVRDLLQRLTDPGGGAPAALVLAGAGGFGKTTLARMAVHDPAVRQAFADGIVWITLGDGLTRADLADRIDGACAVLTGTKPPHTDPVHAGTALGQALGGRRLLLVLDDAWDRSDVEPFLIGGPRTARLVTTRRRSVRPAGAGLLDVDAMTSGEASRLLTAGLAGMPAALVDELLGLTGRWPLLLGLINGTATDDVRAGAPPAEALAYLRDQLAAAGVGALDVEDEQHRGRAVAATLRISLDRFPAEDQRRFAELAVFGEDVDVPLTVLSRYWERITGGAYGPARSRALCRRLADASLLPLYRLDRPGPRIRVHDVVRDYLRHLPGTDLPALHATLLDAHRGPAGTWSALAPDEVYLWQHVPAHLDGAGLAGELAATVRDPRWLTGKLALCGAAALQGDLALAVRDPACRALATVIRQNAHLLAPLEPPGALAATLASRIPPSGPAGELARQLTAAADGPHLAPALPLPDLPHPALTRVLAGHAGGVWQLAAAPSGAWLATAGDDATVRLWDPATGRSLHLLAGHDGAVLALAAAPDGAWLATAGRDGTARLWDPATGHALHTLTGHTAPAAALAAAPDGSWLATAADDGTARVWRLPTGAAGPDRNDPVAGPVRNDPVAGPVLDGHPGGVTALAALPDGTLSHGTRLVTAGRDATARIWDPATGHLLHTLAGHTGPVLDVAVAPDGTWLATTGTDGTARLWRPDTGAAVHTLRGRIGPVLAAAPSPDGAWLASGCSDGTVRLWDAATGRPAHVLAGHTDEVWTVAVAPDGRWLASAGGDGTVRLWDPAPAAPADVPAPGTGHTGPVEALAVAPGRAWCASATRDGTARLWDPATGATRFVLAGHTGVVTALAVAPDGAWLATASRDGTARLWDPATGDTRHVLTGHTGPVLAAAAAPDGSWLATAGRDGTARIWTAADGTPRRVLAGHADAVEVLATCPDGAWLATAGRDGTARLWDPATGHALHTLTGHADWVVALAAPADGAWLATGSRDGTARLWDPATGRPLHTLAGHAGAVEALAVPPGGAWLATAGRDGTARLWDPATGHTLHTLTGHAGAVKAVAAAPDGTWLATAGTDRTVRLWSPTTGACLAALRTDGPLWALVAAGDGSVLAGGARGAYLLLAVL